MSKPSSRRNKPNHDPLAGLMSQGLAAHQAGQTTEALRIYAYILEQNPKHADALHYSGVVNLQTGNLTEGIRLIKHAIQVRPDPAMRCNLANGMIRLRHYDEALEQLRQATQEDPKNAATLTNLGLVLANLDRPAEAIEAHERALSLQPHFPEALNNLGNALRALKRFDEALARYDQALSQKPQYPGALNNRGLALVALHRLDEAIASYDAALTLRPAYAEALSNKGSALKEKNDFAGAMACFTQALTLRPGYIEAQYNRANTLAAAGQIEEALNQYAQVLCHTPEHADAHWNKALMHLLLGQFEQGWADYPWRWKISQRENPRHTELPQWTGLTPLNGLSILVWAEQGLGDTLQFCRHTLQLARQGANVYLEVQPALSDILIRSLGSIIQVFPRGEICPKTDFQCPLMDLPSKLSITLETIPAPIPYLQADSNLVIQWQNEFAPDTGHVGIVCSGNPKLANDRRRSIPLSRFYDLLTVPEVSFHLLHKECRPTDAQWLEATPQLQDLRAELHNFEDTAALIMNMDLVICVDTSVAHLAGALGKPVWLLLPFIPDWRWMLGRTDSPWYPGMHLYRQKTPEDWDKVFAQVKQDLVTFISLTRRMNPGQP